MIKEINKREALHMLAEGKSVYFLDMEKFRLADLSIALDGKLIAEVPEVRDVSEGKEVPPVPVRISDTMTVEAEKAPVKTKKFDERSTEEAKDPSKKAKRKTKLDIGKIRACRQAGRSIAWIAEEMGVSQQTIRNRLIEMGMR